MMENAGHFRKLPTADDTDWLMLEYSPRGLFLQLWRKADNQGRLYLGRHGLRGVCVHVGTPADWPKIEPDLKDLIDLGHVTYSAEGGYLELPTFCAAQGAYVQNKEAEKKRRQRAKEKVTISGQARDMSPSKRTCPPEEKEENRKEQKEDPPSPKNGKSGFLPEPQDRASQAKQALVALESLRDGLAMGKSMPEAFAAPTHATTTGLPGNVESAWFGVWAQLAQADPPPSPDDMRKLGRWWAQGGAALHQKPRFSYLSSVEKMTEWLAMSKVWDGKSDPTPRRPGDNLKPAAPPPSPSRQPRYGLPEGGVYDRIREASRLEREAKERERAAREAEENAALSATGRAS